MDEQARRRLDEAALVSQLPLVDMPERWRRRLQGAYRKLGNAHRHKVSPEAAAEAHIGVYVVLEEVLVDEPGLREAMPSWLAHALWSAAQHHRRCAAASSNPHDFTPCPFG